MQRNIRAHTTPLLSTICARNPRDPRCIMAGNTGSALGGVGGGGAGATRETVLQTDRPEPLPENVTVNIVPPPPPLQAERVAEREAEREAGRTQEVPAVINEQRRFPPRERVTARIPTARPPPAIQAEAQRPVPELQLPNVPNAIQRPAAPGIPEEEEDDFEDFLTTPRSRARLSDQARGRTFQRGDGLEQQGVRQGAGRLPARAPLARAQASARVAEIPQDVSASLLARGDRILDQNPARVARTTNRVRFAEPQGTEMQAVVERPLPSIDQVETPSPPSSEPPSPPPETVDAPTAEIPQSFDIQQPIQRLAESQDEEMRDFAQRLGRSRVDRVDATTAEGAVRAPVMSATERQARRNVLRQNPNATSEDIRQEIARLRGGRAPPVQAAGDDFRAVATNAQEGALRTQFGRDASRPWASRPLRPTESGAAADARSFRSIEEFNQAFPAHAVNPREFAQQARFEPRSLLRSDRMPANPIERSLPNQSVRPEPRGAFERGLRGTQRLGEPAGTELRALPAEQDMAPLVAARTTREMVPVSRPAMFESANLSGYSGAADIGAAAGAGEGIGAGLGAAVEDLAEVALL